MTAMSAELISSLVKAAQLSGYLRGLREAESCASRGGSSVQVSREILELGVVAMSARDVGHARPHECGASVSPGALGEKSTGCHEI